MKFRQISVLAAASAGLLTSAAFGHPGHATAGVGAGMAHPLSGVDHLVTMLAVGMWAWQTGLRRAWMVPVAFTAAMVGGAAIAINGAALPGSEQGILAGLLVIGLLVALSWRMPVWVGAALAAGFAVFHGYAHGTEMGTGVSAMGYGIGFVATTLALIAAGAGLAKVLSHVKGPMAVRAAGAAMVALAVLMFGGVL